jgi:hypothetical protein
MSSPMRWCVRSNVITVDGTNLHEFRYERRSAMRDPQSLFFAVGLRESTAPWSAYPHLRMACDLTPASDMEAHARACSGRG